MGTTKHISTLLLAAAAVFAGPAHAGFSTYFGEDLNNSETTPLKSTPNSDAARSSFLSKLINAGTETFESKTVGVKAPLTLTLPGASGDVTATLNGVGSVQTMPADENLRRGRYSVPSATTFNFWEAEAGVGGAQSSFTVTFGQDTAAFGFYGVDIGDFGGQLALLLLNNGVKVGNLTIDNKQGVDGSTGGSVLYFGLIAQGAGDLFDEIRFVMTGTDIADVFAFDNFTVAELAQVAPPGGVPEPGTLALAGAALLAAGAVRRPRVRSR